MAASGFAVVAATTGGEVALAMQRLWLTGRIVPVGARLTVWHEFRCAETEPVEAIYTFALPRDAALRRFRVNGEGFSVRSELKPIEEAVKQYERGLANGSLATLARQHGDGLISLAVGNIRPGEAVSVALEIVAGVESHDDGLRFRFPFTLAPGYHRNARAAEVEPGVGELELPQDEFGDLILPRFAADASRLHEIGFELAVQMGTDVEEIGSPSHSIRVRRDTPDARRVSLAPAKDVPDRDLVLDVRTAATRARVLAGTDREGRGRFAAVIPSQAFGAPARNAKRVVFVVDRSGSMAGEAMAQARKAVEACLGALSDEDRFGIIAFDNRTEALASSLVPGTMANRERAHKFLAGVDARGGTELAAAISAAAKVLGGDSGDLLVLTDGQVFGTEEILAQARALGIRIHCLGIGSASQDRFISLLARGTGGLSRFVTPRERVDVTAVDLFGSAGAPVASGLCAKLEHLQDGRIEPEPPGAVFAGTPVVLFGEGAAAAEGSVALEWDGGRIAVAVTIGADPAGETLRLIQGARLLTDLESRVPAEKGAADREETRRVNAAIEALSKTYGLASLRMALVAVIERAGDRPGAVPITRIVPVGLPQDVQFSSYFSASASPGMLSTVFGPPEKSALDRPMLSASATSGHMLRRAARIVLSPRQAPRDDAALPANGLVDLAARLEPDGGIPGSTEQERLAATVSALLEFAADGNTIHRGPFRTHVRRLASFLERAAEHAPAEVRPDVETLIEAVRMGRRPDRDLCERLRQRLGIP